jgi:vacuolar-type H+-ATPase subunit C/Vma6
MVVTVDKEYMTVSDYKIQFEGDFNNIEIMLRWKAKTESKREFFSCTLFHRKDPHS